MKELIKQIVFEQQEIIAKTYVERAIPDSLVSCSEIIIISGIRRCGKSVFLNQIRDKSLEKDYYINFDDERLIHFKVEHFQTLHEVFIELFGNQQTFYFDEIQNIIGWERFVRRLYDNGCKIYLTGSNATLLSRELGTHLTGRFIQHELFPFSFVEYLKLQSIEYHEKDFYTTQGRAKLSGAFTNFLKDGGFPQFLENKNKEYLKSLYESILYRDVMIRNKLTNEREILELTYYLASNVAKLSSYNSLSSSIGVKSPTTVKNYIDYLENTYLIFQSNKFDYSLKKQIQNPKKFYFIDNAIAQKMGFSFSENNGRLLENLVYIHLRRLGKEVFYHKDRQECDFVVRENNKIVEAMQICYDFSSEETQNREVRGLIEAIELYNLKEGILITMNEEKEFFVKEKKIKVMAAWKWFLKESAGN
jgi:uncharacterized protein